MKTIMKAFGIVLAVIGLAGTLGYVIVAIINGPKAAWKLLKDAVHFGAEYRF